MLNNPIIGGAKLPTLTNPGTAGDLLFGKQLIDQNGDIIDGKRMLAGINWKTTTTYSSFSVECTYGNGMFVAVLYQGGSDSKLIYSTNGASWTDIVPPTVTDWQHIAYGGGRFVITAPNGMRSAYSSDGIHWSLSGSFVGGFLPGPIAYGRGIFVVVSMLDTITYYSADGATWTESSMPGNAWINIAYGGGRFVATAQDSNQGAYSDDGKTWTAMTLPHKSNWRSVVYALGKFWALPELDYPIASSPDGINWTDTQGPTYASNMDQLIFGGGKFLSTDQFYLRYSSNAIEWGRIPLPTGDTMSTVAYGDGMFVMIGTNGNAAYSADGVES